MSFIELVEMLLVHNNNDVLKLMGCKLPGLESSDI